MFQCSPGRSRPGTQQDDVILGLADTAQTRYASAMRMKTFCILLSMMFVSAAAAQQRISTRFTIVVTDCLAARVPGAQVVLDPLPRSDAKMVTDAWGELAVNLPAGIYKLSVSRQGFKTFAIDLKAGAGEKEEILPVVLEVAQMIDPVTVTSPYTEAQPTANSLASPYTDTGPAKTPANSLVLKSLPHSPVVISADDLKSLPHIAVTIHNPHSKADETYSGVRLSDVFAKMDVQFGSALRGKALADYVVATGSDGYKAVFALAEIDPAFHPGEIIVADTMNGKPLDASTGPFRLVATEDKRPARSVRNLVSLELKSD
jgi:hypothetical protein